MDHTAHLKQTPRQQLILDVLHTYYPDVYRRELLRHVIILATQKDPLYIRVGRAHFLVNVEKQLVISSNFSSIFDYCQGLNDKSLQIRSSILDAYNYQLNIQNLRRMGADDYPITPLLWQVFTQALPKRIQVSEHQLLMKVKFIPNFEVIGPVPDYFEQIISSCEQEARTIKELESMFSNIEPGKIHRLFVLSLLTDILDTEVLRQSFCQKKSSGIFCKLQRSNLGYKTIDSYLNANIKPNSIFDRLFKKN